MTFHFIGHRPSLSEALYCAVQTPTPDLGFRYVHSFRCVHKKVMDGPSLSVHRPHLGIPAPPKHKLCSTCPPPFLGLPFLGFPQPEFLQSTVVLACAGWWQKKVGKSVLRICFICCQRDFRRIRERRLGRESGRVA